jgi:hypothetical protein
MSAGASGPLWTVTFADLETGVWGAGLGRDDGFQLTIGEAGGARRGFPDASVVGAGEQHDWRVAAEGLDLVLAASGDGAPAAPGDGAPAGFEQLCRVRGTAVVDGEQRALDVLGRRGWRDGPPDFGRFESVRDVSAFFEPGEGVTAVSLRRRKARGQADDLLTAVVFDPDGPHVVADPRLSTTYASDGAPLRMGLELWLEPEPQTGEEEPGEQYPRRFAGEALGDPAAISRGAGWAADAVPLRCRGRGHEGAGVYLLLRAA